MTKWINRVKAQLEKLKEAEEKRKTAEEKRKEAGEKAKSAIQAIQQNIDESAKEMAIKNAEHQRQKRELEIGKKLALTALKEKHQKEIGQLEEKYQKESAELEAKSWKRNAHFAKEMTNLQEQLKDQINWNQVDRVMGKKQPRAVVSLNPRLIANAKANRWDMTKTKNSISISREGLKAQMNNSNAIGWKSVSAEKGFNMSLDCPGPVLYYFEVTIMSWSYRRILVGLSNGHIPDYSCVGGLPESYAIRDDYGHYLHYAKLYPFEWSNGAIKPEWNRSWNVIGCGLLLSSKNKMSLFFTGNGTLIGKQIPIHLTANPLYPTVSMCGDVSIEANFGDKSAKPFIYDIKKCQGLVFE